MTGPKATPPSASTKRLRVAQGLVFAGLAGLCESFFLAQVDYGERLSPFGALAEFKWALIGETGAIALLAPYFLAAILLVCRVVSLIARRERFVGWAGGAAAASCFALLICMDIALWRGIPINEILNGSDRPEAILLISWIAMTGAATLAMLMLCAAPARARLAACFAVAGVYSVWFFLCVIAWSIVETTGKVCYGLYVSLASSSLIAVGGIWETKLLRRRDAEAREEVT